MKLRGPALGLILFAVGLVVLGGVAMWMLPGRAPSGIVSGPALVGGPFRMVDEDGAAITDADLKGQPFLVFFGFTHCPDICPTTLFEMSEVFNALGEDAQKASALFVTVDPERDTPEVLNRYLSSFNERIRGLTGDQAAVDSIVKAYRAYAKKAPLDDGSYTMDHTAVVYLMDKNGAFVRPVNMQRTPLEIANEIRAVL
ncbi:SCO family protein [Terrihabitans sp. B22-R8]|uniref:SCO family protein n=1 Tax=Terrihabitans sp. B22-R8 TaxID=3425128 RepID=UPI00403D146B